MEWLARYKNPKMGEINTYLVTDEFLSFMDDIVYVDRDDNTKVIDPKRLGGVDNARAVKCLWLHDMNKGHDTLRRNFIGRRNW
jgi:hypothetical protein